ncbi:hypothetical protein TRAPUB_6985 [Trametes pubescens]|uniref:Uncharacterized protein n=1 Tax=Trametes pubescens TaxID=154538 RepID=A0A1M2V4D8_TRAPU|nr:hypothetical protein TRAPUB_6985 [Trametes pubescens]
MSYRGRTRSPPDGDDFTVVHTKRGHADMDSYDSSGGGGSGGSSHPGGYSQSGYPPPGPPFNNFGPNMGNYGPNGPNYGPNYGPQGFGPPPGNYPSSNMGMDSSGWERAANAYRELAEARQQQAALAAELGDAKAKQHDLRARLRDRDHLIDEAQSKIAALTLERDGLRKEVDGLNDEIKALQRDVPRRNNAPRGFVPHAHDNGWTGVARGRGAPTTPAIAPGPPAPGPARTTGPAAVAGPGPPHHAPLAASIHAPVVTTAAQDVTMTDAAATTATPAGPVPAGGAPGPAGNGPPPPEVNAELEAELRALPPNQREVRRIRELKGKPDEALEYSGQPLSAWYRCWISPPPDMAGAYTEMDFDEEGSDDDDDHTPGVDMVLADPIDRFAPHMTGAATLKEENRARSKGSGPPDPLPSTDNPAFGPWAGTYIRSVVQAHNLRWWALVEWDEEAMRFYKFIVPIYNNPAHVRPEGIRFLMHVQSADSARIKQYQEKPAPRPEFAPRDALGRYPEANATVSNIWRFFRAAAVNAWPQGMRTASGADPEGNGFAVPHLGDCRAFFLLWHLVPQRKRKNPHHSHDVRILALVVELFSIAGWYRRIVEIGEYVAIPQSAPIRYPFGSDDASHIHLAAWFCTHGLGLHDEIIKSLHHWAVVTRNARDRREPLDDSPWDTAPSSLEAVTTAAATAPIVKYDELAWGERLLETHESNHGDFDELIDADDVDD